MLVPMLNMIVRDIRQYFCLQNVVSLALQTSKIPANYIWVYISRQNKLNAVCKSLDNKLIRFQLNNRNNYIFKYKFSNYRYIPMNTAEENDS